MAQILADALTFGTIRGELDGFRLHLEAENKSPRTVQSYTETVKQLADFLAGAGMPTQVPNIRREHVEAYIRNLMGVGRSEATVGLRYRSLRVFFNYMVAEDLVPVSPMAKMHSPRSASSRYQCCRSKTCGGCSPPVRARPSRIGATPQSCC